MSQILLFNSARLNTINLQLLNIMFEGSGGFKPKNDTTSDHQLLAGDQTNLGVLNENRRAPSSIQTNQHLDTNSYVKSERYFLICQSCFWCASYLESEITNTKCPLCDQGKIDCMSVGEDKSYRFNYKKIEELN